MFGLGGGFIYGPVLLTLGAHPLVVASTLLYILIFSSSASMLMFGIFGRLIVNYTLWIALYTGVGVVVGLCVMKRAMKRYKRPSLIVFALALATICAMLFSLFGSIRRL